MIKIILIVLLTFIPTLRAPILSEIAIKPNILKEKTDLYSQIIRNKPNINKDYAKRLTNLIYTISKKYDLKPKRVSAIIAQESTYRLNAINELSKDYGIFQINKDTIKRYKFDKNRLTNDLEYSIKAGAIVLSDFKKRYAHREDDWYCRYNVGTASKNSIQAKCERYKKLISRYYE